MLDLPRLVIVLGLVLVLLGALWLYSPQTLRTLFGWFGNLPGDINYRSGGTFILFPWVSMLVVSVAFSLVAALVRMFR